MGYADIGPWLSYGDPAGSAAPLREGKGIMWEGGCRVPSLTWWPGKIPVGGVCGEFASTIDILPTMAALAGAEFPDHRIDGKDILPLIFGEKDAEIVERLSQTAEKARADLGGKLTGTKVKGIRPVGKLGKDDEELAR